MGEFLALILLVGVIFVIGWMLFEFPEGLIVLVIIAVVVGSCSQFIEIDVEETTEETTEEVLEETAEPDPTLENTVTEKCIDGILYLLVVEDGVRFMAPKENRYGDNERCYD